MEPSINIQDSDIQELHWFVDMVQSIDVGIVVVNKDYNIEVWNSFMQNHSNRTPAEVVNKNLFSTFPDISKEWLERKLEAVWLLKSRAFTTWETRPYLFRFQNYHPITGSSEFMYQNITFSPLVSSDGTISHICIIIYDVTDVAVNRKIMLSANKQLESLSRTDQLTQLNNRGYWEECLQQEFSRVSRTKQNSTLIMFDIDHFKKVNDTYGHQAGDEVIRITSGILTETIRKTDIAGRYGGEEFVAILIDTSAKQAMILAERLRELIASCPVYHDETKINYTVSIGIAEFTKELANHSAWIESADQALYQAKESGRNKSIIFRPEKA